MSDGEWLAQQFEESRGRLGAVAYRILGSHSEADDAVQEGL
jgi:RNA polymerase sigma-70 factor (ECF subfamily)